MNIPDTTASPADTLAKRLAEERIPVPEALRYAMILAGELRKLHDNGRVHGAIAPANIVLTPTGLELCSPMAGTGTVTPYTAPEVLAGCQADARSDVFSLAAVLYEMLTGKRAFDGSTANELTASILGSQPAPSGSPAVDRLMASCLAKDPATRCQRVQKVLLELKLLSVAVRRAAAPRRKVAVDAAFHNAMEALETRITARFSDHEQSVAAKLADLAACLQATSGRVEQVATQTVERITGVEDCLETLRRESAELHHAVAEDLLICQNTLKAHSSSIDSVRCAMTQTDDLVERVVEALDTLQSTVLDQSEDRLAAAN